MGTARDLIRGSLRLIGAIATGEAPSADEFTDSLAALNMMLSSWTNEELLVYSKIAQLFPLISGQQTYQMGTGLDFDTPRPAEIIAVTMQYTATAPAQELPISIITFEEWSDIGNKLLTSEIPSLVYIDQNATSFNLNFWPIPSLAKNVGIYSAQPLTSITDVSTELVYPPGYEEAIKYNLAVRLAPEFNTVASGTVVEIASGTKAALKRANTVPVYLKTDQALAFPQRPFNYLTGK